MSVFDQEAFFDEPLDSPLETRTTPIPKGEYTAICKEVRGPRAAGENYVIDVVYKILDESVAELLNMKEPTARMSIFLDLEDGRLARGPNRNIRLGRVLEAHGLNSPNARIRELEGSGPVKVKIDWRADKNDPTINYSEVVAVSPETT